MFIQTLDLCCLPHHKVDKDVGEIFWVRLIASLMSCSHVKHTVSYKMLGCLLSYASCGILVKCTT